MKRRDLLKISALAGFAATSTQVSANACTTDGTPNQFIPKTAANSKPLDNELAKYPKCPYCGMDRKEHHRTRMLVQYSDDLVDGTCSIHCLSLSLSLNIDREPKTIWGPDYGSNIEPRPLLPVDQLLYLIGADLKHAMTKRSKHSFASADIAKEFQAKHGGTLAKFDDALRESYLDMASDASMIRKNREERRKRAMQQKQG
ncbi:nitrous oxide reductase accessory protein NosL [Azonexus sp. IMCC34842]|uniref:nitrous oxide reductase accessory protein NosL n=1 Tax=Azonexus sp. IMCC34842 TaxID=3420950 RepID=UPI003D128E58